MEKNKHEKILKDIFYIIVGLLLCTFAYRMFLIPNEIAPGGFTGISQLVNHLTGWPIGSIALALNVPLFLISAKMLGLRFGLRSLIATIGFSLLIDYLPVPAVTSDVILASVFGGVVGGVGFGLLMRGQATTGGTDMLARVLHNFFPSLKIGTVLFAVDAAVIIASAFVFDTTAAMYALVSGFLMTKVLDKVLDGVNAAKAYVVISNYADQISARIMEEMDRGITELKGQGAYSGTDKKVLLCVINRTETTRLLDIVASEDDQAFVIAADVSEVLGEGFRPHLRKKA